MKSICNNVRALFRTAPAAFLACGALFSACQDEIDKSAIYTFTGQTVTDILKEDPDLSDYYELTQMVMPTIVSKSPVSQLISTRGHYSCFAPTNEALQEYLTELNDKGIITTPVTKAYDIEDEQVRDSIMKVIVLNSVIDCGDKNDPYMTFDFQDAATLPLANMNDRLLRTDITSENGQTIYKVSNSPIIKRDIEATNGYVQKMGKVVAPSNSNLSDLMRSTPNMTFFNTLLEKTKLSDTLKTVRDEVYENNYLNNITPHTLGVPDYPGHKDDGITPEHRNIGFTIFAEPDDVYRANGISNIEDLIDYLRTHNYYTGFGYDERTEEEGGDYSNPNHIVHQFTAYHILPFAAPYDRLTIHINEWMWNRKQPSVVTVPVYEYCTTLNTNPRRMIKITESKYTAKDGVHGVRLNRYTDMIATASEYDEDINENMIPGIFVEHDNKSENAEDGKYNNESINGNIYPIGEILAYDEENMRNKVLNERIRFDVEALCPELMTNNLRGIRGSLPRVASFRGFPRGYFGDNLSWSEYTQVYITYGWNMSGWHLYQGNHWIALGNYDVTVKLPPVPYDGTYEIRYFNLAYYHRGLSQVYFGEEGNVIALGIPLDFRMGGRVSSADSKVISPAGWEADTEDEDYNDLIDKRMRSNGFMKAPNYWGACSNPTDHVRTNENGLRRILVRRHMERNKTYYLRLKSVLEGQGKDLLLDCLEIVPSNIYNNPEKKEDIW